MVKQISKWQPVQLNEDLLSKGVQNLIAIEELTSYDLSTISQGREKLGDNFRKTSKLTSKHKPNIRFPESKVFKKCEATKTTAESMKRKKGEIVSKNKRIKGTHRTSDDTLREGQLLVNEESPREKVVGKLQDDDDFEKRMEAWSGLNIPTPVLKALADQGFSTPTEIQELTLPAAIMGRRDILGAAETGSGKTLAFGIPIIHGILQQKKKEMEQESGFDDDTDEGEASCGGEEELLGLCKNGTGCVKVVNLMPSVRSGGKLYALILTPTRELAIQVKNHLVAAAKYTDLKVAVVVGGMAAPKQERMLKRNPEIVVATPGRLWELIQEGNSHLSQVDNISYLAIDETDRMLERGHFQELQELLERINKNPERKSKRQNFVFSATLTLVHEAPHYITKKKAHKPTKVTPGQKLQSIIGALGVTNPKVVDVTQEKGTASKLSEARIVCTLEEKDLYLYYLIQRHPGRTLVFCNSIGCVRRLAQLFSLLQCKPLPLHASMMQRQRLKNLDRFRDNPCSLLLATDVAARGLDIPNVKHVIHYQVPRTSESYVHRSGRTARAQNEGITILLVEPGEMPNYTRLCRTLGREQDLPEFPIRRDFLPAVKQRMKLARELDKMELSTRRTNSQSAWFRKAMEDMDIVLDEDDIPASLDDEESANCRRIAAVKRKQLNALLTKPLFPQGFSTEYPTKCGKLERPLTHTSGETQYALNTLKDSMLESKKKVRKPKKAQSDHKDHTPGMFVRIRNKMQNKKKRKEK